ncbi:hypothetical protein [Streptomyces sp. NPDC056291]|uniref:hypothetical protein n=1 Tax=Streptomyces sp. NPDC056291 TaxID=3345772 RepID=UPI0035D958E8
MAEVVFVHGIGPLEESAEELHAAWITALADTLRAGDEAEIADALVSDDISTAMAYYRGLFTPYTPRDDWDQPLQETMAATAQRVGQDCLENVRENARRPEDREEAARELIPFHEDLGPEQGLAELLRVTVGSLARCGLVARSVFGALKTTILTNLAQVAAYLDDESIREHAQEAVLAEIGPETRAVYAHSLGTVVAYEALHRLREPLPLLVTFGSPLGLRTIVRERLRPQPPHVPGLLQRWVNVADRDDYIVASLDLRKVVASPAEVLEKTLTVRNPGLDAHPAVKYLGHNRTVCPLVKALRDHRGVRDDDHTAGV